MLRYNSCPPQTTKRPQPSIYLLVSPRTRVLTDFLTPCFAARFTCPCRASTQWTLLFGHLFGSVRRGRTHGGRVGRLILLFLLGNIYLAFGSVDGAAG